MHFFRYFLFVTFLITVIIKKSFFYYLSFVELPKIFFIHKQYYNFVIQRCKHMMLTVV